MHTGESSTFASHARRLRRGLPGLLERPSLGWGSVSAEVGQRAVQQGSPGVLERVLRKATQGHFHHCSSKSGVQALTLIYWEKK